MPIFYTGGAILAMVVVIALFTGAALFFVTAIAVAPGILFTTLLFKLLSKEFVSSDLWTSSVVFSVIIVLIIRHFRPQKYINYYCTLILAIGLFMGFYNTYINHDNAVMFTVDAMYSSNGSAIKTTATGNDIAVIVGENVNLRNMPSQSSKVIKTLATSEGVLVKKESANWYFVHVNDTGEEGWIYRDYVKKQ